MLKPGAVVFSRYKVVRVLGEGAAGTVYLARDTQDRGRVWAVKSVPQGADEESRLALQREMAILMGLRHPGLPLVREAFIERGSHYLVMERIDGPTLETLQEEAGGALPQSDVRQYGLQLCDVLHYLHTQSPPILHRDLKPSNVMVLRGGELKLVDFGIARTVNPTRARDTQAWGTPGFCAPEQYQARSSPSSDVYALAATLFVLLTGGDPSTYNFRFPDPCVLKPALAAGWSSLLSRALAYGQDERTPSAQSMRESLAGLEFPRRGWLDRWKKSR